MYGEQRRRGKSEKYEAMTEEEEEGGTMVEIWQARDKINKKQKRRVRLL